MPGAEDFAYLYGWSGGNFGATTTPGGNVTFTYNGDDPDSGGGESFEGVRWRRRNISTGAVSATTVDCDSNGDNASKSTNVTFHEGAASVQGWSNARARGNVDRKSVV